MPFVKTRDNTEVYIKQWGTGRAGQQTREMALLEPYLTDVQAVETPRPWVKWSYEAVRAADVPAAFMRAYATAVQPTAGPVFLSLPMDDFEKPA